MLRLNKFIGLKKRAQTSPLNGLFNLFLLEELIAAYFHHIHR